MEKILRGLKMKLNTRYEDEITDEGEIKAIDEKEAAEALCKLLDSLFHEINFFTESNLCEYYYSAINLAGYIYCIKGEYDIFRFIILNPGAYPKEVSEYLIEGFKEKTGHNMVFEQFDPSKYYSVEVYTNIHDLMEKFAKENIINDSRKFK